MSLFDLIKNKLKERKKLREFEKMVKCEKLQLSEEDLENIEIILNNRRDFDFSPQPYPQRYTNNLNSNDVYKIILKFYDSINLGNEMKKIFEKYQQQIFMTRNTNIHDGGYTSKKVQDLGYGIYGISRITDENNYLTYFNTVHEFMHLLINQYDKINPEMSEIHTRFIEKIFGEFLVNKGIISKQENDEHQKANNSVFNNVEILSAYQCLYDLIEKNNGRLTIGVKKQFIREYCNSDVNRFGVLFNRLESSLKADSVNRLFNKKRFVNAAVRSKAIV